MHERLDSALRTPLTLVSAPAGYGKSALVSHWAESLEQPCAWLSLDQSDSDLQQFLTYFVAAVEAVFPGACPSTQEMLGAPELPATRIIAGYLANDLDAVDRPCLIVLDDYHLIIGSSPVHELVGCLLQHPPRQMHLVLASRRDPPLSLAALRAGNQITEVRLQDLRFTRTETAELLARSTKLEVSGDALATLQREVEGWAAGLRLVTLALGGAASSDAFLKGLRGGLPQSQAYLLQEVLAKLTPELRGCLLRSSILDRFCPQLLEAVCCLDDPTEADMTDGQEIVDRLRNSNLFTISLDAHGEWFRYHHLFQHLLQQLLAAQYTPQQVLALHARAGDWFESQGLITESIRHSLAAGDPTHAAEIVERHRRAALDEDNWFAVRSWMDLLPEEIKQQRLNLLLTQAWVDYYQLDLAHIAVIVEWIDSVLDEEATDPISLAELNLFKSVLLYWDGQAEQSYRCCEEAMAQYPMQRGLIAGEVGVYTALTLQMTGKGESAIRRLRQGIRAADPTDDMFLTRWVAAEGFVHLQAGDLASAVRSAQRLEVIARRIPSIYAEAWGRYVEALARFHAHRLDEAVPAFQFIAGRKDIFERRATVDALAGLSFTYQLLRKPDLATRVATELVAFARDLADPEYLILAESSMARLSLLQGELGPALDWARSIALEPHVPSMFCWLEVPWITQVRAWIAEGSEKSLQDALESLVALGSQLESLHFTCHQIETVVLRALCLQKLRRTEEAQVTLGEALDLAAPGGWIRPFVEAGPAMADMLRSHEDKGRGEGAIDRILTAFSTQGTLASAEVPVAQTDATPAAEGRILVEALTNRELDVLECLAQRLSNKEIATRLFVSAHTVSDHLKHIYEKLRVHGRREAVKRAVEIGILSLR